MHQPADSCIFRFVFTLFTTSVSDCRSRDEFLAPLHSPFKGSFLASRIRFSIAPSPFDLNRLSTPIITLFTIYSTPRANNCVLIVRAHFYAILCTCLYVYVSNSTALKRNVPIFAGWSKTIQETPWEVFRGNLSTRLFQTILVFCFFHSPGTLTFHLSSVYPFSTL